MVFGFHAPRHQCGQTLQQGVARTVAAGIVDQFETIQIDVTKNEALCPVLHAMQRSGEPVFHRATIQQTGEMVAFGLPGQALHQAPVQDPVAQPVAKQLCDRVVWLERGQVKMDDIPQRGEAQDGELHGPPSADGGWQPAARSWQLADQDSRRHL